MDAITQLFEDWEEAKDEKVQSIQYSLILQEHSSTIR